MTTRGSRFTGLAPSSAAGLGRSGPAAPASERRQLGNVLYTREAYTDTADVIGRMARLVQRYRSVPVVRDLAVRITRGVSDMRRPQPIAEAVHAWIQRNIRYVLDPDGVELLQSPDHVLRSGYADCDGMSVLATALLAAVGVRTGFEAIAQHTPGEYDHVYVVYRRADGSKGVLDPTRGQTPGPNPNPRILSRTTYWLSDMRKIGTGMAQPAGGDDKQSSIQTTGGGANWENILVETINTVPEVIQAFRVPPEMYAEYYNRQSGQDRQPPTFQPPQQARILGMKPSTLLWAGAGTVAGLWALNRFVLD